MKERIIQFLRSENKTSAQFADEIGVQASSISHIISGRNNPSLDFVMKMLSKYPSISSDWLLFGKGNMMREAEMDDLFNSAADVEARIPLNVTGKQIINDLKTSGDLFDQEQGLPELKGNKISRIKAVRIVYFFGNNTFTEYFPHTE